MPRSGTPPKNATPAHGRRTPSPASRADSSAHTLPAMRTAASARPSPASACRRSRRLRGSSRTGRPRRAGNSRRDGTPVQPPMMAPPGSFASRRRPARRIAPHGIVGSLEPLAMQQVMDPRHPQAIAARQTFVLDQQRVEALLERTDSRKRLHRPVVIKRPLPRPDRLTHRLARQLQSRAIALIGLPPACSRRIRTTVSTTNILTPPPDNPGSRLNHQNEGSLLDADHPAKGVPFARRSTGIRFRLNDGSFG